MDGNLELAVVAPHTFGTVAHGSAGHYQRVAEGEMGESVAHG